MPLDTVLSIAFGVPCSYTAMNNWTQHKKKTMQTLLYGDANIIDVVLEFLDRAYLLHSASLVCKQWYHKVAQKKHLFESFAITSALQIQQYKHLQNHKLFKLYLKRLELESDCQMDSIVEQGLADKIEHLVVKNGSTLNYISKFPHLKTMYCKFTTTVFPVVPQHDTLQELYVRFDKIVWRQDVEALVSWLRTVPAFVRIKLGNVMYWKELGQEPELAFKVKSIIMSRIGASHLKNFTNVNRLHLYLNHLPDSDMPQLCQGLALLPQLRKLSLTDARSTKNGMLQQLFTSIPTSIVSLFIARCPITEFPQILHLQDSLEILSVTSSQDGITVPDWISTFTKLKKIFFIPKKANTKWQANTTAIPGLEYASMHLHNAPIPNAIKTSSVKTLFLDWTCDVAVQDFASFPNLQKLHIFNDANMSIHSLLGLKQLVKLELEGVRSSAALTDHISNMPLLKLLTMRYCGLTSIPQSFAQLEELECMDVSSNPIVNGAIPNLSKLKKLFMNKTKIDQMPDVSHLKQLQLCDVSGTPYYYDTASLINRVPITDALQAYLTLNNKVMFDTSNVDTDNVCLVQLANTVNSAIVQAGEYTLFVNMQAATNQITGVFAV